MFKKIMFILLLFGMITTYSAPAYAADESSYTQLRSVDIWTFNEYRYKITEEFFVLRNKYEINQVIDVSSANRILTLAQKGYNYLPDSLSNKNYFNYLKTAIERGVKFPNNESNYASILSSIENYLEKTNIQSVKWTVEAYPSTWNAPLNVTLRWNVADPTWTKIPRYNYTWRIYENWAKRILGDNISLNHLFKEEWKFSVFLDVSSSHKNEKGYIDVLPFSSRADITIKEKVASVIIKVNSTSLRDSDELKFTPDEARYWLLFDATSSTPTSGSEFIKTSWDFGNWIKREYSWDPRVERVKYVKEWDFTVTLTLKTNELKSVERKFFISIHDPIATINSSQDEGYLWDKFTFSAKNSWNDKDLSYAWEIINLNKDETILRKAGSLFTYSFDEKGKYNIKMIVTEPSWETDVDSKIIYINSRPPTADFVSSILLANKPNKVFLDATKSFDPDFTDDGKLKYSWIINGERVELEEPNFNGSTWYFTFDSVWEQSVVLDIEDPDGISSQKKGKVSVKSILSVDFFAFPRVAQRLSTVKFESESPEAKFYEWDFWDWYTKWWTDAKISHKYEKSGTFKVKLQVRDANDNVNSYIKNVYIWESNTPFSYISVIDSSNNDISYDAEGCGWKWAYIVNRVDTVSFSWKESIDITGKNDGLTYSWKLWNELYKNSQDFTKKFDELGCFPIKLSVKSDANWKTHSTTTYVDVRNLKPILSSIDINIADVSTDPVIVNLSALWAQDRDWVIQSYLWYYYTDVDSEPQDFRSTKSSTTSFVLPKVTWNYYFVVLMKDNNEEVFSSEELNGSKYFIALTGDNLNTPLVKLSTDDSSVSLWDEVTFTSNVENILWQDLTKKVKYSWDFDGDWFYDKETSTNTTTYKYLTSWEKHAKVKVKYKWFSNTKSITIDVSNILKPDFWYISIWNKFIFFDKSIWSTESIEWDLWDGTIINNKKYFTHTYTDSNVTHQVNLRIAEWTKIKEINQKVVKNLQNTISARKDWLILFSNTTIVENKITLENKWDKVFLYLWESKPDIVNYVIDYNIENDSDLNWWNEDDEDNSKLDSYTSWEPIEVVLNDNKVQKIRVFVRNTTWKIVGSRDLTITKNYIEEEAIDINTIIFEWVSESTKLKIEKLKDYVDTLPKENKLKASMYIQKLKEEWSDNREKTNIILEFEGYIFDTGVKNRDEIIDLLESLLVENQEDKSEKAITFNALKNLLPTTIICTDKTTWVKSECYSLLVSKLETIRDNDNIEQNKILWAEILDAVAADKVMTNKQKTDFKAILKTLVYWWVDNIPAGEQQEIIDDEEKWTSNFMWLLLGILKWIFYIIIWFTVIVWAYYIYYLLVNKDKNVWFQDFIIEKTSWVKHEKPKKDTWIELDILKDLSQDLDIKNKEKEVLEKKEDKTVEKGTIKTEDQWVPDWLKWSFADEETIEKEEKQVETIEEKQIETKTEIPEEKIQKEEPTKTEDQWVPDWLKWSFADEEETIETNEKQVEPIEEKQIETKIEIPEEKIPDIQQEEVKKEEKPKKIQKADDDWIPDWLKWSFSSEDTVETIEKPLETKIEIPEEQNLTDLSDEKIEEIAKVEEDNIPDWLKWSFSEEKVEEKPSKVEDDNIPDWLKWSFSEEKVEEPVSLKIEEEPLSLEGKEEKLEEEKVEELDSVEIEEEPFSLEGKEEKVEIKKVKEEKIKTAVKKKETKPKQEPKPKSKPKTTPKPKQEPEPDINTELWDDWMKVPDWLKTDDEK